MRLIIGVWVLASSSWAQSPHVYRPVLPAGWEGEGRALSGNASGPPFFVRPIVDDPTPRQQEDRTPPMFANPNCFICPNPQTYPGGEQLFQSYTTERFIQLAKDANSYDVTLRDRCVFYTRNTRNPVRLSRGATELACYWDKLSIWHLWPNAKNARDTRNHDPPMINYYGVHTPGETLYFISQLPPYVTGNKPRFIQYFENMSRAMARMCSGQVYLVTDMAFPFDLNLCRKDGPYWPNIWASTEFTELGNRIAARKVDDGALIVIEFSTVPNPKPRAWKIRRRTLAVIGETVWKRGTNTSIPAGLWEPYDLASELPTGPELGPRMGRRASCNLEDTGLDSEPDGMDFFG